MKEKKCKRIRGCKPETEAKYRSALELYAATGLSYVEICRQCGVSLNGFSSYIGTYHRHLMLKRNGIKCNLEEAGKIKINQRCGQRPETHAKYKEAIAACDSMDHIGYNVSQIAREFGLNGTNLARQLRTHYPEVLEFRERERQRLGLGDNLPRGTRPKCKEQYAKAVELLHADRYITVQEAAERCDVSYSGLEQHLIFYHKELVENRIKIRKQAVRQRRKGKITGRGTLHAPTPGIIEKYAEALRLYRTTTLSARKIAKQTGVSIKGFYEYLQTWHKELVCQRKGIPYEDGTTKIFFYTKGTEGNPGQELCDMLKYIEHSTTDNVTNQTIDELDRLVSTVKQSREAGINYMKSWEHEKIIRDEERRIGIEQGIRAFISFCQELSFPRSETAERLADKFDLSTEKAAEYLELFWPLS